MICRGCGNQNAVRIRITANGESCDSKSCGDLSSLRMAKKGGFMFKKANLHSNKHTHLAKQVRQEYLGTDHDEQRGPNY